MAVIMPNISYRYYHLEQPVAGDTKQKPALALQSGTYAGYLCPARASEQQAVYFHDQRVDAYLYTDAPLRWYVGDVVECVSDNRRWRVVYHEVYQAGLSLDHTRVFLEAL